MTNIILKIRDIILDNLLVTGRDVYIYESIVSSKIFVLTESNITTSTIVVKKNGSVWAAGNYSFNSLKCELTVTGTLAVGDSLEIDYSYYQKYSDTELQGFIRGAVSYLVVEKYKCFIVKPPSLIFPTPTESEENLIAIVASILIKGDIISYRTPELTINFERGDSKEKKIHKFVRHFKKAFGYLTYIDPSETVVNENEDIDGD